MGEAVTTTREIPGVGSVDFVESDTSRAYWFTPEGGQRRQRLPSVTTILGATWAKPFLLKWYAKHGSNAERMLDAASERGKAAHRFVEDYLATGVPTPFGEFLPEHRPYIQGVARFLWEYDPQPEAIERLVVHPEDRYAGRYDLRAKVHGKSTMLDFKTNERGLVYAQAHVQAHAYSRADERCGAEPVEAVMLVGVAEDGAFNVVEGIECADMWAHALDFYRAIRKIENAVAKGQREAVAA